MEQSWDRPIDLVLACRAGNERAQRTLWLRYHDRLQRFTSRWVAERDALEIATDVLADFLTQGVFSLREPRLFESYLLTAARRRAQRVDGRRRRLDEFDDGQHVATGTRDPDQEAETILRLRQLEACLGHLTARARQVLSLKFGQDGITDQEIGVLLGVSKQAVSKMQKSALSTLRQCLDGAAAPARAVPTPRSLPTVQLAGARSMDEAGVEELLRVRSRLLRNQPGPTCPDTEELTAVWLQTADEATGARVADHCRTCPECEAVLADLRSLGPSGLPEDEPASGKVLALPRRAIGQHVPSRWLPLAAVAALVLALGIGLWSRWDPARLPDRAVPGTAVRPLPHPGVQVMGDRNDVFLGEVVDGRQWRALREGEVVAAGGWLKLLYSTEQPGYLAVLRLQRNRRATWLYPAGGLGSAPIEAALCLGFHKELMAAGSPGCEWLVAVFSKGPLPADPLQSALSTAAFVPPGCDQQGPCSACTVQPTIPEARSIRVLAIKRESGE